MNKAEVLEQLSPCGLDCGRCVRFKDGKLAQAAKLLEDGLQRFSYTKLALKVITKNN